MRHQIDEAFLGDSGDAHPAVRRIAKQNFRWSKNLCVLYSYYYCHWNYYCHEMDLKPEHGVWNSTVFTIILIVRTDVYVCVLSITTNSDVRHHASSAKWCFVQFSRGKRPPVATGAQAFACSGQFRCSCRPDLRAVCELGHLSPAAFHNLSKYKEAVEATAAGKDNHW